MAIRLYLSSQGLGSSPGILRPDLNDSHEALIVLNALDPYPNARQCALPAEMSDLASLGYHAQELDLRQYFHRTTDNHQHNQAKTERLTTQLSQADLIWVAGGNTFVLARAMQQASFKEALLAAAHMSDHEITYAGYSAGAAVAGPDLQGIHLMDDPNVLPEFYDSAVEPIALNFVPERIIPHYQCDNDESASADLAVDYLERKQLKFRTLSDGDTWITTYGMRT